MSLHAIEVAAVGLGACIGSFLNVVIHRLPQEDPRQRSLGGRSRCPSCLQQISWRDNIPVLGWLLLRGRSRCCKQRISARYPLVEALTAALFFLLVDHGPRGSLLIGDSIDFALLLPALYDAAFVSFLVASAFIDWDHRILPDALTIPFMALGCTVVAFTAPGYAGVMAPESMSRELDSIVASAFGLACGYGLCLLVRNGARPIFGREAMGFGDVKFMGAIGAFLGWQGALWTFFLGSFLGAFGGLLHRLITKDPYVPFGPFLALGALLTMFFEEELFDFVFRAWPEWQRNSPSALPVMAASSVACILALVLVVRRGRRNG